MKKDNIDKKGLKSAIGKSRRRAIRENKIMKLSTIVARNGKLIKIDPDGSESVIGKTQKPVRISQKEYELN